MDKSNTEISIMEKVLIDFFSEITRYKYCIYNGYEKLPTYVESDLDIAIEKSALRILDNILYDIANRNGLLLLHKIWHDDNKYAYILSPSQLNEPKRLQIDFFCEFSIRDFKGNIASRFFLLNENDILVERKNYRFFYVPPPHKEFIFKFLRRILKQDLDIQKFTRLTELYSEAKYDCERMISRYFPKNKASIMDILDTKNIEKLISITPFLKKELNRFKINFINHSYLFNTIRRTFFRVRNPVGMTVAFLGPDGSGKSTLVKNITAVLNGCFHGQTTFYWRPGFLKQPGVALKLRADTTCGTNPNPHGHKMENPIRSFARFSYYLADFTFGYIFKVWRLKVMKHLCIFDRYYYDVFVDTFRYNFSLPKWFLKLPLSVIPKPDLTIILNAPVEELLHRKQELSEIELIRQRKEYLNLARVIPNAYIVNNSKPLEEVIQEITSIILLQKSYRTYFTLNLRPDENNEYFSKIKQIFGLIEDSKNGKIVAYPKSNNPRVYISTYNLKVFKSSLALYSPSRPIAKFLHNNAPKILLYSYLRNKSEHKLSIGNSTLLDRIRKIFPTVASISIYTGSPGPHRKPLIQVLNEKGKVPGYIKIGIDEATCDLVKREEKSLNLIKSLGLKSVHIPEIVDKGKIESSVNYLALKSIDEPFKKSYNITKHHLCFIREMFEKTGKKETFKKTSLFAELQNRLIFIECRIPYYWSLRYQRIIEFFKNKPIPVCLSHGDLTPWNSFITKNRLLLFDWEYCRESVAYADLFHFILQPHIFALKKPLNGKVMYAFLSNRMKSLLISINYQVDVDWEELLLIYLLEISSFYFYRNYKCNFIEKDLRLEITWAHLIDYLLNYMVQ